MFEEAACSIVSTAIEVNGSNSSIVDNKVRNYKIGCLISPVGGISVDGITIYNNTFEENKTAIQVWSQPGTIVENINIQNNIISGYIKTSLGSYAIDLKTYCDGEIHNTKIIGNNLYLIKHSQSDYYGAILIGDGNFKTVIKHNRIKDFSGDAIAIYGGDGIIIKKNVIVNCSNSKNTMANRVILINPEDSQVDNVVIKKNQLLMGETHQKWPYGC